MESLKSKFGVSQAATQPARFSSRVNLGWVILQNTYAHVAPGMCHETIMDTVGKQPSIYNKFANSASPWSVTGLNLSYSCSLNKCLIGPRYSSSYLDYRFWLAILKIYDLQIIATQLPIFIPLNCVLDWQNRLD